MTITFLILGAVVVLFVWNRIPVELVAVGAALSLYFTGVLEVEEALTSFGDPAVVLIAALFVVSEGLDATGVTAWAGVTKKPIFSRVQNPRSAICGKAASISLDWAGFRACQCRSRCTASCSPRQPLTVMYII